MERASLWLCLLLAGSWQWSVYSAAVTQPQIQLTGSAGREWPEGDPASFARPEEAAVTAAHLQLRVQFAERVMAGSVRLTVQRRDPAARHVVLDTRDLRLTNVTAAGSGAPLRWTLGREEPGLGRPLTVDLPPGDTVNITIEYSTSPNSSALAWLAPQQTAGRRHPYVFSQCQAVHCRSLLPIQDTPAAKLTYTAEITVPGALTALMSALREGHQPAENGTAVYRFRQPVPIPAYLIALAVGELESRPLGPRSSVWAEPEVVDKAAYEFADTEKMLQTAEDICGPYVWGVYDLLVLPPSFPYGGMENPCLTFVTPTLLAGDRSLANVVAHEIAHSWTGNLVTNRNWEHFWLNEGFTKFLERKIQGRLLGEPVRHMSAIGGWKTLTEQVQDLGADNPMTNLVIPRLEGQDLENFFSSIPYEKGHTLLWYLEELVGGPNEFDPFLMAYVDKFKYKTLDTEDFRSFLLRYFADRAPGALADVDWDVWFSAPGMPPYKPAYNTSLTDVCSRLSRRWVEWNDTKPAPFTSQDLENFSSEQIVEFLAQLLQEEPLSETKLETMEELYGMNARRNAEIRSRWLRLCIAGRWRTQVPMVVDMVTTQGRLKFTRPLYRALYAWPEESQVAIKTYKRNKENMMYVAQRRIGRDLNLIS